MVYSPLKLTHWLSVMYTLVFYWPTGYLYGTLLCPIVPMLSLWYTSIFYWPTGYLYGTLPPLLAHLIFYGTLHSPIGPLAIPMVHYYLLLAKSYLFFCTLPSPTGPLDISIYTTIFYWLAGYLFGTLPSQTGPLDICNVHSYILLAHCISLWYIPLSYWLTGYPYGTPLSSTGPFDISMVHYYLLLAHWLSLWYTTPPN